MKLDRIYQWLLLSPVLLPVVFGGGLIYPYLVPKTLLFYALTFLSVGAFGLLVTSGQAFYFDRLKKWEVWIPALLLGVAYGTSYLGVDFYRSFWSLFVRGDGLLMLSCEVASFYLIVLSADQLFSQRFLRAVAVVGSFVAVYGIGEWLVGGGRIGSLFGNAAFFANYLALSFFATLVARRSLTRGGKKMALVGAILQIIAIVLTATRGTMLALFVALVVLLGYVAVVKGEKRAPQRRAWAAGALLGLVVFSGIFFAFREELAHSSFTPIARIATISNADADVASRLFIWQNMLDELKKNPLLGVGAEHIDVLFNRFYDPTQISEQWFDRSHNAFLDYFAQYGVFGFLLYIALIASFFIVALRLKKSGEGAYALFCILIAVTYAVQNFFVFDTVSSFWLLLALLAVFSSASVTSSRFALATTQSAKYLSWIGASALLLLLIPVSFRPALAAYDLAEAYKYQLSNPSQEEKYLSHGFALGTYGNLEYGYEVYDMYTSAQVSRLTGQDRIDAYQSSLSVLTSDFNEFPYDARTALYLAHVLTLAPEGVTVDQNLLSSALERAVRLSPKRSQPWYILANLSISNANAYPAGSEGRATGYAAARDLLTHYVDLVPTLSEPHFVLAQLLYASGQTKDARAEAEKGKLYYKNDLETASRAAGYYETTLDLQNAKFFLTEIIRLDPANSAAKDDLEKIQAYEQSGK